ncbi:MAG: class IV adenylate cyclase [Bacteroidota bacterium]
MHINIEIKASCTNPKRIKELLVAKNADFKGVDHQIDTYYKSPKGRLKLRAGTIENTLIHYERDDQAGPKQSNVVLFKNEANSSLGEVLRKALEILAVVDKKRAIYFIDNVKFHVDEVEDLGSFVEIEAIDSDGSLGIEHLQMQCRRYMDYLGIENQDLIEQSYSDLLLKK